jgi:hypothetical protein
MLVQFDLRYISHKGDYIFNAAPIPIFNLGLSDFSSLDGLDLSKDKRT